MHEQNIKHLDLILNIIIKNCEHEIEFFNKPNFFNKIMQSVKESILAVIKNLPNDASYDDIMEALYINHKINIGIEQLENGNSLTLSQLRERLKSWIE